MIGIFRHDWGRSCSVLVLAISLSCALPAQTTHRPDPDTLAIIEDRAITSDTFARLFREKVVTLGLPDNFNARKGYLSNLVDDEILIAEAKKRKLDRTKESKDELARIQVQQLLNAFSERRISPALIVTDDDLRDLFVKMNTKIQVRHLYAATKPQADSLYAQLSIGRSFEELAQSVFNDPRLRDNGGSLGYISIDETDLMFETAAYAMHIGEVSKPVKTVQGYSILRVDDIQRNPFLTESEFLKVKERLRGFAHKRKYEQALAGYSATLRRRLDLRFNSEALSRLFEMTRQKSSISAIEHTSLATPRQDVDRTLVTSTSGAWTVRKVIDALRKMPEPQKTWIRTQEDLEDAIAGLIMRQHIVEAAKKEKLDTTQSFRARVQHAFDTYLLTLLEDQLREQLHISEDSMKSYYLHNKEAFRTQPEIRLTGILLDHPVLADSIQQLLQHGVPFDHLAQRFSIQRATAEHGGDLGFFRKEALGEFGANIFALRVGEWTGPLVQDGKYLFVQCTGLKPSSYRSFEESSREIEELLLSIAWRTARGDHVESFRNTMDYRVYPDRLMTLSLN